MSRMLALTRAARAAAALTLCAGLAGAQGPRGADSLSPAAVTESLSVLRSLQTQVAATPTDAPAWYRLGMIAWALSDRARATPPLSGLDWTLLGHMADTSLRIAAQLAPQSSLYHLMVGRYLLSSGVSITRFASGGFFDDALIAARQDSNPILHAETAVEAGRVAWRRYDAVENRRIETSPGGAVRSIVQAAQTSSDADAASQPLTLKAVRDALELNSMPLPPDVSGQKDYDRAEALFHEAFDAAPDQPRPFRQYAMLLAARDRWTELSSLARARLERTPWDGWAWMTYGLAAHRLRDSRTAAAAFDSAMNRLSKADRTRLDRLERILRHSDTTVIAKGSASQQAATRRLYWLFADPLWSREGNESRIEFLARVTYAELRWTVEEMGVSGVDSDRGDIYVRYGPPNLIASFGGDVSQNIATVSTVWVYNSGLMFTFEGAPTFATARIPLDDQRYVDEVREAQPVRWDNLASFKIDSMAVQIARFRAGATAGDSVDLYVAADPAYARVKGSSTLGFNPRADFWLLAGGTIGVFQDSVTLTNGDKRAWTRRIGPGNYVYRLESSTDGGTVAARAVAPVVAGSDPIGGFSPHGFGLSDLLLATRADQRNPGPLRRWTDLRVAPVAGPVAAKSQITLVWETYELTPVAGAAQYHVAVIMQKERSTAGRLMAKVISGVSSAVGVERTDDRVAMRFDRNVPHSGAVADAITIGLDETPPGAYRVTLEVTDQSTGRTASRTSTFVIAK